MEQALLMMDRNQLTHYFNRKLITTIYVVISLLYNLTYVLIVKFC